MIKNLGQYLLTGLKGLVVSIMAFLILIVVQLAIRGLVGTMSGIVFGLVVFISIFILFLSLALWGWLANKLWRWT